jgi:hypothetical protein
VYRTEAIPDYSIAENYDWFVDVHFGYYALRKSKGFYFPRIFGVYNVHEQGVYSKYNVKKRIEITYKWCEEIYRANRDKQSKKCMLVILQYYLDESLIEKEKIIEFYKEFVREFPEVADESKEYLMAFGVQSKKVF